MPNCKLGYMRYSVFSYSPPFFFIFFLSFITHTLSTVQLTSLALPGVKLSRRQYSSRSMKKTCFFEAAFNLEVPAYFNSFVVGPAFSIVVFHIHTCFFIRLHVLSLVVGSPFSLSPFLLGPHHLSRPERPGVSKVSTDQPTHDHL